MRRDAADGGEDRMTSRAKRTPIPERASYDRDYYTWTQEQAALLDAGRLDRIDAANIAEELRDLGKSEFRELESALRLILQHMLKWDHQPNRRTRSWSLSIAEHRVALAEVLADNPGLKARVDEAVARAYRRARLACARETRLAPERFAETCPYSLEEITGRAFDWA
jgi:Domain of unknown function DUF29